MRPFPYYIALCLLLSARSLAAGDFGSVSGLLMAEGLAVRAMGLSRAYAALADDEASLQVNPAGLASHKGLSLGGGHVVGILDERISYLNGAWRLSPGLSLGLQSAYSAVDEEARDAFGAVQGSFSNRQLLLGLGAGGTLLPGWRLGVALKALQEELGGGSSLGVAADLGLQADLPRGWRAGAAVLNAGTQLTPQPGSPSAPTPLRVQAGLSAPFFTPRWQMEADLQALPYEGQARLLLGSELGFRLDGGAGPGDARAAGGGSGPDRVVLRAGAQLGLLKAEDSRLSLGAGLAFGPRFTLDYALAQLGRVGNTHRFSASIHFAPKPLGQGPRGADLSAPYGLQVTPQLGGLQLSWSHADEAVQGYNLYSDYGVLVERLNDEPLSKTRQRFIKVERSRTYHFYVRPVGSDGKEGPSSEIKAVRVK